MKIWINKLLTIIAALSISLLIGCQNGDDGLPGRDGADGQDGQDGQDANPPEPPFVAGSPEGVGNCQPTDGVWYPPDGENSGSFSGWIGHPCPQPRPGSGGFFGSMQTTEGDTTTVVTPEGQHIAQSPFDKPPGSNFLNTVDSNLFDFLGAEMQNTQPSALGSSQYMLHEGPVTKTSINKESPSEGLRQVLDAIRASENLGAVDEEAVQFGLDILEGNHIPDKAYSGFPMLHFNGPNKIGVVEPIYDEDGLKIGGNLDVEMLYWDQHIESNTALVDPSQVQDVPWTVTYRVNILTGGIEDFSPMVMHFDVAPDGGRGPFHAAMDQSYFPMLEEGKRYTVKIKETQGKYFNLVYTWGWRIHPPRVQVMENALKTAGGKTLVAHEVDVFGLNPMGGESQKLAAIAKIGDLSPAKRMWNLLQEYTTDESGINATPPVVRVGFADEFRAAYLDWQDRTKLPAGVTADPDSTLTLLYVNNTIYGSRQGITGTGLSGDDSGQGAAAVKGICNGCAHDWNIRPYNYKVTLYNGDHFPHGYVNVDFGGSRGWENQYQDTDPTTALAAHTHTEETVILGNRTQLVDHVLLDNTSNEGKRALRNVPQAVNDGQGVSIISGDQVEDNITVVTTNDRVFPMNSGGMEEFLESTPRALTEDGTINDNAKQQFGSGCFFTFGRHHAWPNAGGPWGPIIVPPVDDISGVPGMHKVKIEYNFEPSRRLKIYQFDPLHHDVAVYSLH